MPVSTLLRDVHIGCVTAVQTACHPQLVAMSTCSRAGGTVRNGYTQALHLAESF